MTQIVEVEGADWLDEHRTCDRSAVSVFKVVSEASGNLADDLAERSATLGAFMDRLAAQPHPVAITGSAWSQSDLFASPAVRVDTALDRALWSLPPEALADTFTGEAERFVMSTGGSKLKDIMAFLDERELSFRTAGSHKGQSIGGAIATGTHGSLLGEMGLETHVRGLLFISGTGEAHWIADPSRPVLSEAFVNGFAKAADPALFEDAIIHLGGLGYCAGVLIEAIPRFGLSWKKAVAPLSQDWWQSVEEGDFASAAAPVIGDKEPAFYELTFDPKTGLDAEVMQTLYWRDPLAEDYTWEPDRPDPPEARDALDLITDAFNAFSAFMVEKRSEKEDEADEDGLSGLGKRLRLLDIADMIFDDFRKSVATKPVSDHPESLLALTGNWKPREVFGIRVDTFNAAFAIPVSELRRTLEIGEEIAAHWRRHFVFTVRFAAKSRASMSFLRFEGPNAIINIDGLTRAGIAGWISHSDEFSRAFTDALEEAGIPFSMHWGKDIPSNATKIAADFGPAAERYRTARAALVPDALRAKLCPPQLARWGLD
ncbi:MAG: hypothetical protein AAFZ11_02260 [Pseudomonadota bacterium]